MNTCFDLKDDMNDTYQSCLLTHYFCDIRLTHQGAGISDIRSVPGLAEFPSLVHKIYRTTPAAHDQQVPGMSCGSTPFL